MYSAVIKTLLDVSGCLFNWRSTSLEHQSEKEVISDKRDCERVCNYAETAIEAVHCSQTPRI